MSITHRPRPPALLTLFRSDGSSRPSPRCHPLPHPGPFGVTLLVGQSATIPPQLPGLSFWVALIPEPERRPPFFFFFRGAPLLAQLRLRATASLFTRRPPRPASCPAVELPVRWGLGCLFTFGPTALYFSTQALPGDSVSVPGRQEPVCCGPYRFCDLVTS